MVREDEHWWINKSEYAHRDPEIGPACFVDNKFYYVCNGHNLSPEDIKNKNYDYKEERDKTNNQF